jgi:hypothetical protein
VIGQRAMSVRELLGVLAQVPDLGAKVEIAIDGKVVQIASVSVVGDGPLQATVTTPPPVQDDRH